MNETTREARTELLCSAEREAIIAIADDILAGDVAMTVTRRPESGGVVAQVREPIARQRFLLADVLVTQAEVMLDGHAGWAMRMGEDREATLAQAVCDAEVERSGPATERVLALATSTRERLVAERVARWSQLEQTVVEFEEIP